MAAIILPRKWQTQPQGEVELDYNSQLSANLICAPAMFACGVDKTGRFSTQLRANSKFIGGQGGVALVGTGTYIQGLGISRHGYANSSLNQLVPSTSNLTVAIGVIPYAIGVREIFFSDFIGGGSASTINLEQKSDNTYGFYNGGSIATGTVVANKFTSIAFTRGAELNAWVDGKKGSSAALGTPGAGNDLVVGAAGAYGALLYRGRVLYTYMWEMELHNDEIIEIHKNPWQVFKKQSQVLYFTTAGGAIALDGTAAAQSTATGALTTQIPISGAAAVVATAAGALSTAIPLAGQSAAVSLSEGILTTTISLSGASLAEARATASLTAGSGLSGAAGAVASALASLTTQISLSGASLAEALAQADLTAGSGLTGAASGQASASGALLTEITLVGASQSYSTAAGGLTTIIPLTGVSASVASATGNLTLEATWSGAALAEALAGGTLTTVIRLDGAALGVAAASGSLGVGTDTLPIHARHTLKAARRVTRITASQRQYRIAA